MRKDRLTLDTPSRLLGDRVRAARLRLKLYQGALAAAIGTSPITLSQWETGKSGPHPKMIRALVEALGEEILPPPASVGEALKNLRGIMGLSVAKAARRLGTAASRWSSWESGSAIGSADLERIGREFGCAVGAWGLPLNPVLGPGRCPPAGVRSPSDGSRSSAPPARRRKPPTASS